MTAHPKSQAQKRIERDEFNDYLSQTRGLERDYVGELTRSKRMAWRMAFGSLAALLLGLVALGVLEHNLAKPATPFVLRVDNATGNTDMISVVKTTQESYGEVVDKYWLNQYVESHESYDYHTIQRDYDLVGLLSAPWVAQNYQQRFIGKDALNKVLKDSGTIAVLIHSIVPDGKTGTASVRFSTLSQTQGQVTKVQNWIATLAYKYVNAPLRESDRLKNPLGFQVTSYRVDEENPTESVSPTPPVVNVEGAKP